MAAPSPETGTSDLTTFTVLANGSAIDGSYQVVSLRIEKAYNRIPQAYVEIVDGDPADGDFPIAASAVLVPGTPLEVQLGYHGTNASVFTGVVTRQSIRQRRGSPSLLRVEAQDNALKMTIGRRSAVYTDTTDSAVLKKVIGNSGLSAKVDSTTPQLKELTQYYATDWDFLIARAEANGLVVNADAGTVTVTKPDPSVSAVLTLTYGDDVWEFRLDEDAPSQLPSITTEAWDFKTQAMLQAQTSIDNSNAIGSPGSTTLATVVGPSDYTLQSSSPLAQDQLTAWVQGAILRSELAKIRGELRFQGSSLVAPGKTVALVGFSDRFDGTALVSAVTHVVDRGVWETTVEVGLEATPFVEEVPVTAPAAGGLNAAVPGLLNATVKAIQPDPDGDLRVQVQVPVLGSSATAIWARLAMPYATNTAGIYFYPEVGDEVLLGFINGDPSAPVILGAVYNASSKAPPWTPDDKNSNKGIVTAAQLKLWFDDANKVITVTTPGNNQVVLSDKDQNVVIKDQNGNSITLSSAGIAIKSAAKITLDAQTDIAATATGGNISLAASAGKISGASLNIELAANAELKASANAQASVQSSGILELQGSLVKIN